MPDLSQTATDYEMLVQLYHIQSLLRRMTINLSLINKGVNAQNVVVAGGNLFEVAAKYYQDATKWELIARANNLIDSELDGLTPLIIPPDIADDNGGLLVA